MQKLHCVFRGAGFDACVTATTRRLRRVPGVHLIGVDTAAQSLTVTGHLFNEGRVVAALQGDADTDQRLADGWRFRGRHRRGDEPDWCRP